jgi:hypothetical protein
MGKWQMANGKWQMANGKWQMANGKWQMADDGAFFPTATVARRSPRRLATAMPQTFKGDHRLTRVSSACAARNSASRAIRSPLLLILPLRSISPDAYLRGVNPKGSGKILVYQAASRPFASGLSRPSCVLNEPASAGVREGVA